VVLCFLQASDGAPGALRAAANSTAAPVGPIPATLFNMCIVFPENWPSVSFFSRKVARASWRHLEPQKGQFNWAVLDEQVSVAQQHGATILYTSDLVPQWAAKDPGSCRPSSSSSSAAGCKSGVNDGRDWDEFVAALATRYKGKIEVYELWNEPDQDFTGPMSDFVPLTQHMHDIIRKIDPDAMIASPAPVNANWADRYFSAGGVKDVDVVTVHGYPTHRPAKPEILGPEKAEPMKTIMAKYGIAGKPLWDTEASWGDNTYGVNDPQEQAGFVARFYLLHWSNGFTRFYWYSWDDNELWGTLWDNKSGPHPAAIAYEQVQNWMVGATMTSPCTMASDSTWTCALTRLGGGQALAIWNAATSKSYAPAAQYTEYRDLAGNTVQIRGPVTIGRKPLLLMSAEAPAKAAPSRPESKQ